MIKDPGNQKVAALVQWSTEKTTNRELQAFEDGFDACHTRLVVPLLEENEALTAALAKWEARAAAGMGGAT